MNRQTSDGNRPDGSDGPGSTQADQSSSKGQHLSSRSGRAWLASAAPRWKWPSDSFADLRGAVATSDPQARRLVRKSRGTQGCADSAAASGASNPRLRLQGLPISTAMQLAGCGRVPTGAALVEGRQARRFSRARRTTPRVPRRCNDCLTCYSATVPLFTMVNRSISVDNIRDIAEQISQQEAKSWFLPAGRSLSPPKPPMQECSNASWANLVVRMPPGFVLVGGNGSRNCSFG